MTDVRCPGQDMRYWRPEDIFEAPCAFCGKTIEFWKDEPFAVCPHCKQQTRNPRVNAGCAGHCEHRDSCK